MIPTLRSKGIHVQQLSIFKFCFRIAFLFFSAGLFFFSACHSAAPKVVAPVHDSVLVQLPAPSPISAEEKRNLGIACQAWYDSVLGGTGFNGGVVVAKGGNIVFEKYHGFGHLESHDTINSNMPFHIASVSKTITAMAVLKLKQDSKLSLDDEFSKYFPAFNYPGVTIRTLLDHRSGLPNYLYFMEDLGWNKSVHIKNQDVLDWLISKKAELKNIAPPDTHFTYCNTNYALLALLVEKLTATPFPDYIQKTFFTALQMKHSFIFTQADSGFVTPSYDWRGRLIPMNFLDFVYGDKNVYTTPEDLLIWDRALRTNLIFTPQTFEQAYTPYSNEKAGIRNYGLGWRMNIYPDGEKVIYHNGWWHGNNASFIRLIKENATIIVMGNRYTNAVYKSKYLIRIFNDRYLNAPDDEGQPGKNAESMLK